MAVTSVTFTLPFPDKVLWPNGRAKHWAERHRAIKAHREWARLAVLAEGCGPKIPNSPVSLAVTVRPKTAHAIDRDNCVAALKSYIDGIADALGVDDRLFDTPSITFGEKVKGGRFDLTLTYRARTPE